VVEGLQQHKGKASCNEEIIRKWTATAKFVLPEIFENLEIGSAFLALRQFWQTKITAGQLE
jgi:hypothetical protein